MGFDIPKPRKPVELREGLLRAGPIQILDLSDEKVRFASGWNTPRWVDAELRLPGQPAVRLRVEVLGKRRLRAVVTSIELTEPTTGLRARHLRELAASLPDLPGEVLAVASLPMYEGRPAASTRDWDRAVRDAVRAPGRSQVEREDEVLGLWEGKFQPRGLTQREAAEEIGLAHSTFRSYLTHARARRDANNGRR